MADGFIHGIGKKIKSKFTPWAPNLERAKAVHFFMKGERFDAKMVFLYDKDAKKLGLNPDYFRPHLKIYYLDEKSFARFRQLGGFSQEVGGFYPLSKNREEEKVALGQLAQLSLSSRVMVLEAGCRDKRLIIHEILHDVLVGGGMRKHERDIFVKNLFFWAYKALNSPERGEEARFFQTVANNCARKFNLKINGDDIRKIHEGARLNHEAIAFIGECFAYAGEIFLGYSKESEIGKLPREIRHFFENTVRIKAR